MKNTVRVSYRLPVKIAKALEIESEKSRRTKTAVLIIAIEDHIARAESDRLEKPVDTRRAR
jgi:predicted DNA-binding protein